MYDDMTGKLSPNKFSPWVKVRVMVRVRLGDNISGCIFPEVPYDQ